MPFGKSRPERPRERTSRGTSPGLMQRRQAWQQQNFGRNTAPGLNPTSAPSAPSSLKAVQTPMTPTLQPGVKQPTQLAAPPVGQPGIKPVPGMQKMAINADDARTRTAYRK
jgi:hypothetical protein